MPTATRGGAALILLGALLAQAPLAGTAAAYQPRDPAYRSTNGNTPAAQPSLAPTAAPTGAPTGTPTAVPTDTPTIPPEPDPTAVDDRPEPAAHSWSELAQQVQQTSPNDLMLRVSTAEQAAQVMRCFKLDEENYCLGLGFVDKMPSGAQISAAVTESPSDDATAGRASSSASGKVGEVGEVGVEQGIATGDQSPAVFVTERAAMPKALRIAAELEEMQTAWDGRDKARSLRLMDASSTANGTPGTTGTPTSPPSAPSTPGAPGTPGAPSTPGTPGTPPRTPEPTRSTPSAPSTPVVSKPLPSSAYIMKGFEVSQEKGYWCGPATFQSIDWADDKQKDTQASWAKDLGSTSSGTGISSMVKQTNLKTKWDIAAGTYIVQNVSGWNSQKFLAVHQKHLGDAAPAPVIEHVQLLKRYFPYLAFNHSGHYQVGRGYDMKNGTIGIFEVFNERRFNSRGNTTNGPKNIPASAMFNATLANSFKNIGL
ncbi:peptidase C39-like protein [Kribbella voronezhensis]|uniref:Peptidase C39-like protein n=1 Tax=Kribbella voronezhensis TaxID=2512212 RepID=A0A4R7SYG5_9ACTN|nr:C39 family peptidase [Kribbella voronezhensis]TDU83518.1 peptidase C39-like protein [Kribbella voronezhensis]